MAGKTVLVSGHASLRAIPTLLEDGMENLRNWTSKGSFY